MPFDNGDLLDDELEIGSDNNNVFIADKINDMDDIKLEPEKTSILLLSSLKMVQLN